MTNIVTAAFGASRSARTRALHQWDYGQILQFVGLNLPDAYMVHFSNVGVGGTAKTQVGNADGVDIPDEYLITGQPVYAWVYLHTGADDGETVYSVVIPVTARPKPTEDAPTPQQQGVIDQAIAALNAGVQIAEDAVQAVQDMGVEAETLPAGSEATVEKSVDPDTGAVTLEFGIPRGDTGATGAPGEPGPQGAPGTPGQDGVSPVATVTQTSTGATVSITDAEGTTTAEITNGQDGAPGAPGAPGEDGAPGISPTISVTDITGGHRVVITGADGAHSFDVMDGEDYVLTQQDKEDIAADVDVPVQDVQVDGTSVVDAQGVANVPKAETAVGGAGKYGVVLPSTSYGTQIVDNALSIAGATDAQAKAGTATRRPVTPSIQHQSTFYGLAKAAGDATQSASDNAVGTYTDAAKVAIQKMLGIYEAPWELIREDTFTNSEAVDHIITTDANGEPFELSDLILILWVPSQDNIAIIGDYGRVYFRNDNTNIRCVYLNAVSIPANSSIRVAIARLTQNNGLMSVDYAEWTIRNNHQNIHVTSVEDKNANGTPFGLNDTPINSISISTITGTMGYRLLGKRKWN